MANNENTASKTNEKVKDNRVEVFVPRGNANDDQNELIGVNGVLYALPKGKKSLVPNFVAAEYERKKRAAERRSENIGKMLEASRK